MAKLLQFCDIGQQSLVRVRGAKFPAPTLRHSDGFMPKCLLNNDLKRLKLRYPHLEAIRAISSLEDSSSWRALSKRSSVCLARGDSPNRARKRRLKCRGVHPQSWASWVEVRSISLVSVKLEITS